MGTRDSRSAGGCEPPGGGWSELQFSREALAAFHGAEAEKGRRLTAVDLRNQNRVAALMAWHFEPRPAPERQPAPAPGGGPRARGGYARDPAG